jgi:type I restriction enzyme S subunit
MSSEWTEVAIGQVCEITSSKRIFAHEYVEEGVPFYGSKEIIDKALGTYSDTKVFISDARFSEIADKFGYPTSGDLLLSSVGNRAGIPYVIKDEGEFYFKDGNLTWFRKFNGLNSHFLCHWMKSAIGQSSLNSIMIGSAQKALTITCLLKLRISLPSLQVQERITATLNALDDRIALLRETNATLEAIAQALFKSWFVDFDPVRAKMEGRLPEGMDEATAGLFPDSFDESELGLIPAGWRVANLGVIAEVIDCLHSKKPELIDTGRPFLQLNNIRNDGLLDTSEVATISNEEYEKWTSRIEVSAGDCVITNVGRVGAVAQVPSGFKAAMGRNMTAIRLKNNWPYPTFLIELLQSQAMRSEIDKKTDAGTILNALNVRNIPLLRCFLATSDVMKAFERVSRPLRAGMEQNIKYAHTLVTLRDTLLPRLISGQLRLPEVEASV